MGRKEKKKIYIYIYIKDKKNSPFYVCPNLVCVCVCSVAQSCLTLCNPTDCSPPGSSFHGIFQARILEWVAISYSRGFS